MTNQQNGYQDHLFNDFGSGSCRVCGRTLSNPVSIQRGIGPVCSGQGYGHASANPARDNDLTDRYIDQPLEEGVIIRRDTDGTVETNIPHLVIEHSPTGFEFGYGGSGPADLALNICEAILRKQYFRGEKTRCWDGRYCFTKAYKLHQDYKWKFIASLPDNGGTYDYSVHEAWIMAYSHD